VRRLAGCALLAAALGTGPLVLAQSAPSGSVRELGARPPELPAVNARTPQWLTRGISRVELQIDTLQSLAAVESQSGARLADHPLYEDYSRDLRHFARRATQRMVSDELIEALDVDRFLSLGSRGGGGGSDSGSSRRMEFDFGIHSLIPEVELKTRLADGQLKLSIDASGDIGLRYRAAGVKRGDFGIGFDGDDTFRVLLRVGF
jgi:hypothetical protein